MNETANIDPEEIRKFEELASRWWDPQSEFKPLHAINPLRFGYINERTPLAGKKVIDVGCGGGLLSEAMAQAGADVTGIDMGETPLAIAREHAQQSGVDVRYEQITAENMASNEAGLYDIVTCLEMLEHVPDPAAVVAACSELLKPGGTAYFSTINRTAKGYVLAVIGAEYVLNLLPKGTHDYNKFIRPSELEQYARDSGFSLQHITGLHYNPLTQVYRLGPGVDVNYMMHCVRADG
ncbi:MAG: bifunctional 2-polyprenyl-6-hydroxyphenol methylase/3-demethylubiquinol 3-O-methyltransferase UbiG [Gammaproteobacteria bacterium]